MKELIGDDCFRKLDEENFIVFFFTASWCNPCQKIYPFIEELFETYNPSIIQIAKIDIDNEDNEELCTTCKITSVPTFMLFKDRTLLNQTSGGNIQKVQEMIESTIIKTMDEEKDDK
jgi:thioredoxin 1